jgi:hypothetical protein
LIDSIHPKWNPTIDHRDLGETLALTREEVEMNNRSIQTGEIKNFDPNIRLDKLEDGFRIFAFGEVLNEVPAR